MSPTGPRSGRKADIAKPAARKPAARGGRKPAAAADKVGAAEQRARAPAFTREDDLKAYAEKHDLPPHPLTAQGYRSIGCMPCTRPVNDGEDQRAGRWAGSEKTECGIHLSGLSDSLKNLGAGDRK